MGIGSYSADKTKYQEGRFYGGHVDVDLVPTWFLDASGAFTTHGVVNGLYPNITGEQIEGVKNRVDFNIGDSYESAPASISSYLCIKY
jgi:hypothetical protein